MKRLGYYLHRLALRLLPIMPFIRRERVRVVLLSSAGNVLLIRSWFSHQDLALPGGGIEAGETPEQAVVREVAEETGLSIRSEDCHFVRVTNSKKLNAKLLVYFCEVADERLPQLAWPYRWEIIDRQWCSAHQLPDELSDSYRRSIQLALERRS